MNHHYKTTVLNNLRKPLRLPLFEKALRKVVHGKSSRSLIGRAVPNNYLYPKNSLRTFTHEDLVLELDIHDYVAHYLYFGFKEDGHRELFRLAKAGDIVLDVGTNVGYTLAKLAIAVGDAGSVYGFEPDRKNYEMSKKTIALNNISNVKLENIGFGHKVGNFVLVEDTPSNRGKNRITSTVLDRPSSIIDVLTLDHWAEKAEPTKINLIKIDVEGYELNVLKGGRNTLLKFRPTLFIELDDENLKIQQQSASELVKFIEELGYEAYESTSKKVLKKETDFTNCHFDIIARPCA